ALWSLYGTAGRNDERLTGGHIPLARRRQARINVSNAFRDLTELDRGSAGASRYRSKRREKRIGRRIEMRAAHGRPPPFARPDPRADRLSLVGAILQQAKTLGLYPDDATPDPAARRRGDDARDRHAAGNDGEIDGKFIAAGQELPRTIEWV